jgi:hypothetical protein
VNDDDAMGRHKREWRAHQQVNEKVCKASRGQTEAGTTVTKPGMAIDVD